MKTLFALAGLLVIAKVGTAQSPNTVSDAERGAGWRLLFDGKTTAGWRNYGKKTISDGWVVQDGALSRVGAGGDIITNDEFKNFELSIDWKIEPGQQRHLLSRRRGF